MRRELKKQDICVRGGKGDKCDVRNIYGNQE